MSVNKKKFCNTCGETEAKLWKCSRCYVTHYCSTKCQFEDFSEHRTLCCVSVISEELSKMSIDLSCRYLRPGHRRYWELRLKNSKQLKKIYRRLTRTETRDREINKIRDTAVLRLVPPPSVHRAILHCINQMGYDTAMDMIPKFCPIGVKQEVVDDIVQFYNYEDEFWNQAASYNWHNTFMLVFRIVEPKGVRRISVSPQMPHIHAKIDGEAYPGQNCLCKDCKKFRQN